MKHICLILLLVFAVSAHAEVCDGIIAAGKTSAVISEAGGQLTDWNIRAGQRVARGELLGRTEPNRVYADQDGSIALLYAASGETGSGAVLELQPVSGYTVYCTVSEAYDSADTQYIHSGERVYIKCTTDGTHRGVGIVTSIDDDTYQVQAIGGEFLVGETVYLYRDEDFTSKLKVGIGTAVASDTQVYSVNGCIIDMCVEAGESVERGELLFTWSASQNLEMKAQESGIVTEVSAHNGDMLEAGQIVAGIAPADSLRIEVKVEEKRIRLLKDTLDYYLISDPEETLHTGTVSEISQVDADGFCTVYITPDEIPDFIGLGVKVILPEEAE